MFRKPIVGQSRRGIPDHRRAQRGQTVSEQHDRIGNIRGGFEEQGGADEPNPTAHEIEQRGSVDARRQTVSDVDVDIHQELMSERDCRGNIWESLAKGSDLA